MDEIDNIAHNATATEINSKADAGSVASLHKTTLRPSFRIQPISASTHSYGLMVRKVSNGCYYSDECHSQENTGQRRKDVSAVHFELQYMNKAIFRTNTNFESMAAPHQLDSTRATGVGWQQFSPSAAGGAMAGQGAADRPTTVLRRHPLGGVLLFDFATKRPRRVGTTEP